MKDNLFFSSSILWYTFFLYTRTQISVSIVCPSIRSWLLIGSISLIKVHEVLSSQRFKMYTIKHLSIATCYRLRSRLLIPEQPTCFIWKVMHSATLFVVLLASMYVKRTCYLTSTASMLGVQSQVINKTISFITREMHFQLNIVLIIPKVIMNVFTRDCHTHQMKIQM